MSEIAAGVQGATLHSENCPDTVCRVPLIGTESPVRVPAMASFGDWCGSGGRGAHSCGKRAESGGDDGPHES